MGANQGWYTLLASTLVGSTGRVSAIEASSSIFDRLQRNVALNGIANVTMIRAAAWNKREDMPIYPGPEGNMGATSLCPEASKWRSTALELVTAKPLVELVPQEIWSSIRLVKIDVEGGEWEVTQGLQDMLKLLPESAEFVIEITPKLLHRRGHRVEDILTPFRSLGFNLYRVPNEYEVDFYLNFNGTETAKRCDDPITEQTDLILSRRDCFQL